MALMQSNRKYPHYDYPVNKVPAFVRDVLLGRERSFRQDARACLGRLKPPLAVQGMENLPAAGPGLILFNHYYRRGFDAWWLALALASVVGVEIHFMMTDELTFAGRWYSSLGSAASRWLIQRISAAYNFTPSPPMPPRPGDVERRAASVREFLEYARSHPQAMLGLAPEGGDNPPSGALARPHPGVGRFLSLLAAQGLPFLPAGMYEQAGEFCLHFGQPWRMLPYRGMDSKTRDRLAAAEVMEKIAALLPASLRGEYAGGANQ